MRRSGGFLCGRRVRSGELGAGRALAVTSFLLFSAWAELAFGQTESAASGADDGTKTRGSEGARAAGRETVDEDSVGDEAVDEDSVDEESSSGSFRDAATADQQETARKHFREGNRRVKESLFVQAVEEYEQALAEWDHPGIHYNLALALLNLDQPLRLRHHLMESLKYGPEAVGRDKALRAAQYLKLVERQLTELSLVTSQKAEVELDGELVLEGPGKYQAFVRPGQHPLLARGEGFESSSRVLNLVPGEAREVEVRLYTPEEWLVYERRYKPALPIAVTVTGAVVTAVGGALFGLGVAESNRYNRQVEGCPEAGCEAGDISAKANTGEQLQTAGILSLGVGGAALVTGGVLLYLNRAISRRVDPESRSAEETNRAVSWSPVVTRDAAVIRVGGTF